MLLLRNILCNNLLPPFFFERHNYGFEIDIPILRNEAAKLLFSGSSNDVEVVLRKGFEVKWMIDDDGQCDNGTNSCRRCGFNQTSNQPTCLCKDGAYERSCGTKEELHVNKNNSTGK